MRPQFNISLDGYPELPEKIRKLCKVRGYRIYDFCARALSDAVEKETSELSNYETLRDRVKRIESDLVELRSLVANGAIANNSDPNILPTAIATNLPPSIPPSAIDKLRELLDAKKYPSNRFAKLRDAIAEIIGEIERSHQ